MWLGVGVAPLPAEAARVAAARRAKEPALRSALRRLGVPYPAPRVYLRGLKREHELEVWVAPSRGPFRLYRSYPILALSGLLSPKRGEGDRQVPEGFYRIDRFNPYSNFHLSLGLDYPNARDRAHGLPRPGGDIFVHGNAVSIGCLAMGDPAIQEIFLLAFQARRPVRVDIFPTRMNAEGWRWLAERGDPALRRFWASLRPGYVAFERTRRVPSVKIRPSGYVVLP